jgi:non-ribosomal peptide synthetase component E (peptide arylation enzyme)
LEPGSSISKYSNDQLIGDAKMLSTQQPRIHSEEEVSEYHEQGRYGTKLLVDYLDSHAKAAPDKTGIIEADRGFTYQEIARLSENVAASLVCMGVGKGDVVAVQAPNWAELPIMHFATNRIGAIFVPLSEGFRKRELLHLLSTTRVKVFLCPEISRGFAFREQIEEIRDTLPCLEHVITMRATNRADDLTFEAMAAYEDWRAEQGDDWLIAKRADADAPSHVMVSSGTTGLPRCSLFSDNNTIVKLFQQYVPAATVTSSDISAALAPAGTGATGYNYPILLMLVVGGTSVMLDHWSGRDVDRALKMMHQHSCTHAVCVPAQLAQLVQTANLSDYAIRLRVITYAGAKLPPSVANAAEQLFSCKVQGIYGTSEAGATAMTRVDDSDEKRRSTVGRPVDGQRVKIIANDGTELGVGEVGEVCWRGPNKSYGFLNDEEGTARVWGSHGWLHSGDLGCIDSEGYLSVVGRKKDMIIRGGQNVNPGAIEEVLLNHPEIAEVAIVAYADAILGERIAACVVTKQSCTVLLDSLKAAVLAHGMAPWHQPELLLHLSELPRNAGGKVDKNALSAMATAACTTAADTSRVL